MYVLYWEFFYQIFVRNFFIKNALKRVGEAYPNLKLIMFLKLSARAVTNTKE